MGILDTFKKPEQGEINQLPEITRDDEFLSGAEVCRMLHIADKTLLNWEKAGRIKSYQLNTSDPGVRPEITGEANKARGKKFLLRDVKKLFKTPHA